MLAAGWLQNQNKMMGKGGWYAGGDTNDRPVEYFKQVPWNTICFAFL